MTPVLSHDELRAAVLGLSVLQRALIEAARPVPPVILTARRALETTAYREAMSRTRQENEGGPAQSETWIGTQDAAQVLGWHPRKIQRRRTDLGGQLVGGRLVFPAAAVHAYAKDIRSQHQ